MLRCLEIYCAAKLYCDDIINMQTMYKSGHAVVLQPALQLVPVSWVSDLIPEYRSNSKPSDFLLLYIKWYSLSSRRGCHCLRDTDKFNF